MDDLHFYILFNSISVISGQWEIDNERLCAMELPVRLRRFRLERESNLVRKLRYRQTCRKGSTERAQKNWLLNLFLPGNQ